MTTLLRALRAPLVIKLAGAHLLVLLGVVAALLWRADGRLSGTTVALAGAAVAVATIAHLGLVLVALRPIRDLEEAAARVWQGDLDARVSASPVADSGAIRLGSAFNVLLDGLAAERAQLRELTSEIIRRGDEDRSTVARELLENTAQRLAALTMHLAAAHVESDGTPALAARLEELRVEAGQVLEEVRALSEAVYPRVLDDLGIAAALKRLARTAATDGIGVVVTSPREVEAPTPVASALYYVADQALRNAVAHAHANRVQITLSVSADGLALEVADDGRGFDVASAERRRPGMGLFTMRGRVSLMGGRIEVHSTPGQGTRVLAWVPMADGQHTRRPAPAQRGRDDG
jgi:signal transduction histidine kinase